MASARVEGGSQVSPRPRSQCVFILPVPGERLVLQQDRSSAGTWGDGAGRQAQPEKQAASLLSHILSSNFKKERSVLFEDT